MIGLLIGIIAAVIGVLGYAAMIGMAVIMIAMDSIGDV